MQQYSCWNKKQQQQWPGYVDLKEDRQVEDTSTLSTKPRNKFIKVTPKEILKETWKMNETYTSM